MTQPSEPLINAAEGSSLTSIVPRHLIRSYVEILQVPQSQRESHMRAVSAWLQRRGSSSTLSSRLSSATSSAGFSSKRSTKHSIASTNTNYSRDSAASFYRQTVLSPALPFSINETPTIDEEQAVASALSGGFPSNQHISSKSQQIWLDDATRGNQQQPSTSGSELRPFTCPWCEELFTRSHDMKKHIREHCGSRTLWLCLKCGNRAHSMRQANRHRYQDKSSECKTFSFQKITLDYDRQAYGCRHYGYHFTKLDDYLDHLARWCHSNRVVGKGDRNFQIRALLKQPLLEDKLHELCCRRWGAAGNINRLWWNWPQDNLAAVVERLEYGIVEEGQWNCGISPDEIDSFLSDLIDKSALIKPQGILDLEKGAVPRSQEPMSSTSSTNRASGVSNWLHNLQQSTLFAPPVSQQNAPCIQDATFSESPELVTKDIAHRPKRPVSHNSAQHPESASRSGTNPFVHSLYDNSLYGDSFLEAPYAVAHATFLDVPSASRNAFQQPGNDTHVPPSSAVSQTCQEDPIDPELEEIAALYPGRLDPPPSRSNPKPGAAINFGIHAGPAPWAASTFSPGSQKELHRAETTDLSMPTSLDIVDNDGTAFDEAFFASCFVTSPRIQ